MVSEVDICNRALIMIHADPISSLTEDNEEATFCSILYPQIRDEVLRAHFWNFAMEETTLNLSAEAPVLDLYSSKFLLPPDYIRIRRLENDRYKYKIKGKFLYSNTTSAKIEYVKKVTDTTLFDPLFVTALATKLASELAYPIAGSDNRAASLRTEYKDILAEAKRRDGQEGTPDDLKADTFVDSRHADTGGTYWTGDNY